MKDDTDSSDPAQLAKAKKKKDKKEKKIKKEKKDKKVKKAKKEQKRKERSSSLEDETPLKKHRCEKNDNSRTEEEASTKNHLQQEETTGDPLAQFNRNNPRPRAESSSLFKPEDKDADRCVTLLLFYQYVEPVWNEEQYQEALRNAETLATRHQLSGRMRVAREGFNCTLTSKHRTDMYDFCQSLRDWNEIFYKTEFKLTHDLPSAQAFPQLKVIPVVELVHYGLEGRKAPPIAQYSGVHLEPTHYHQKLAEPNTVVIDVRNHYEAVIGHFQPPFNVNGEDEPPKYIDPKMRKSTEFPAWLDHPETQEELKGKQVLMFCTGGIRCERASALLKYKMATDPVVKGTSGD
jgi:predicted sulfurtransferase